MAREYVGYATDYYRIDDEQRWRLGGRSSFRASSIHGVKVKVEEYANNAATELPVDRPAGGEPLDLVARLKVTHAPITGSLWSGWSWRNGAFRQVTYVDVIRTK